MLDKLLNLQINDIIITGYTEQIDNVYLFRPMNWWAYLIVDKKIIEFFSDDGSIILKEVEKIGCNFDIEENDLFTLTSITKENLGIIQDIEYNYDNRKNLNKIVLKTSSMIISFDALSIEGFQIKILPVVENTDGEK